LKSAKELIAFATHIDNKLGFKLAMLKRANTAAYAAAVAAVSAVTSDSDSPPSEEDGSPSSDPDDGGGGGSSSMTGEEVAEGELAYFRACVDGIFDGAVSRMRRSLVPPSARAVVLTAGAPSPTRGRQQLALVLDAFLELCATGVTTLAELGLPVDLALPVLQWPAPPRPPRASSPLNPDADADANSDAAAAAASATRQTRSASRSPPPPPQRSRTGSAGSADSSGGQQPPPPPPPPPLGAAAATVPPPLPKMLCDLTLDAAAIVEILHAAVAARAAAEALAAAEAAAAARVAGARCRCRRPATARPWRAP